MKNLNQKSAWCFFLLLFLAFLQVGELKGRAVFEKDPLKPPTESRSSSHILDQKKYAAGSFIESSSHLRPVQIVERTLPWAKLIAVAFSSIFQIRKSQFYQSWKSESVKLIYLSLILFPAHEFS